MIKPFVTTFCNAVAAAFHTFLDHPDQCRDGCIIYGVTDSGEVFCAFIAKPDNVNVTHLLKGSFLAQIFESQMEFGCTNHIPETCTFLIPKLPRLLAESADDRPQQVRVLEFELHQAILRGIMNAITPKNVARN